MYTLYILYIYTILGILQVIKIFYTRNIFDPQKPADERVGATYASIYARI